MTIYKSSDGNADWKDAPAPVEDSVEASDTIMAPMRGLKHITRLSRVQLVIGILIFGFGIGAYAVGEYGRRKGSK